MKNRISLNKSESGTVPLLTTPQIRGRIKPLLPWRIYYRARQFFRGIGASVSPEEMLVAAEFLPRPALALFCRMPLDAQRHSFNVLYTLDERDCTDPDLRAAALLHDVGKIAVDEAGIDLTPWLRIPLVLLTAIAPKWIEKQESASPQGGWRYLLFVHREHAKLGAEQARAARCSDLTCWLIEHHQASVPEKGSEPRSDLLRLLQWADHRN